jgi:tetratricopeptide (TPR) repeat protein
MKQKLVDHRSLALIAWMGLVLVLPIQAVGLTIFPGKVSAQQPNVQLSEEQLKQLAKSITVKVVSGENTGSGIILKKNNQVYTVITNRHVLEASIPPKIQTEDGKIYPANVVKGVNFQGKDLALLQFRTTANYRVAPLGNLATVTVNEPIYAAGFPSENQGSKSQGFVFKAGQVLLVQERAFKEGYQIGYSNEIEKGMSGGPILNRRGQVIGINGIHAYPLWGNPYVYEDGSRPTAALQDLISRYSWGIPIQTLARLAPEYTTKESQPASNPVSQASLPPIANEVNNIAQEITVRIDVPTLRECSGSGVIIGKQGNTYSVLTAEHVVRGSKKCDRTVLEIITSDGKQHQVRVSEQNLKTLPETDLAVLQFTSNQNYRVATIANYDIVNDQNYIFVSGWLGPQPGGRETERQFTAGSVAAKQGASILARNSLSLSYGYGLVYTNLTYKGMSGGPILDIRGRVIGIHGKAELEEITDKTGKPRLIPLGFSWGVPISTFVRWSESVGMASLLKLENNKPPKLTPEETKAILEALFKVEKPQNNADAIDWLNYGWELARNTPEKPLGENQAKEAFNAINKAIELEPNFYQAWYLLGFVHITRQDYPAALKAFDKATQIEANFSPAWRWHGLALANLARYPEALKSFDQLARLDPDDANIQIFRSLMLLQAKRFPEALEVSNRVVEKNPGSWAYFARGAARIATGDLKGAMADLNEAIRLNPEYIQDTAYSLRASLRALQKDYQGAIADYTEAVRFDPEDPDHFKKRSAVRFQQQDYKGAIADLDQALRLKPKDVDALKSRTVIRRLQQDYKGALADVNEVLRLKPDDVDALKERAGIRILQQDYKGALADVNEVLRLKPDDVDALKSRAGIRRLQQDNKGAIADLDEVLRLKPDDVDALQFRAGIRSLQQDYKGAIADLDELLRLKPDHNLGYYYRGLARAQIKDYQGAVADYNQILNAQELVGIGVQVEINAQTKIPTVSQVINNSPAQKGGIKAGDQILAVDGKSTTNMTLEQVIKLIRGQQGTQVALRINRTGNSRLNTTLTRSQITADKQFADVYYHRGLARTQMQDYQGARQDWQKAADLYQQQGKADEYQKVMARIRELQ